MVKCRDDNGAIVKQDILIYERKKLTSPFFPIQAAHIVFSCTVVIIMMRKLCSTEPKQWNELFYTAARIFNLHLLFLTENIQSCVDRNTRQDVFYTEIKKWLLTCFFTAVLTAYSARRGKNYFLWLASIPQKSMLLLLLTFFGNCSSSIATATRAL